ncbi:MAG: SDR family NAD(P)-dependent oxidoreductase [Thermoflexaceae bacterium]|nr:SDR family NAD(P)-dependent oxidoreductase [Thermoflexaceae bacterium]
MDDAFRLEGRLAVVTGGSRGIGFAIARAFVDAGARVVITARNADQLREAEAALGPNAIGKVCDNADPAQIARAAEEAWRLQPVTVLVNNAGVSSFYKRAEFVTVEDWDPAFDINVRGTFFWSAEIARRLFEAKLGGSIINMSSVAGIAAAGAIERVRRDQGGNGFALAGTGPGMGGPGGAGEQHRAGVGRHGLHERPLREPLGRDAARGRTPRAGGRCGRYHRRRALPGERREQLRDGDGADDRRGPFAAVTGLAPGDGVRDDRGDERWRAAAVTAPARVPGSAECVGCAGGGAFA